MRHYTLAELASPKGAREFLKFLNECEKPEESVLGSIVRKLERAIRGGTGWSDTELERIVQEEIEELIDSLNSQHDTDLSALRGQVATLREACEQFLALWPGVADGSRSAHPDVRMAVNKARAALAATADTKPQEARHE